MLLALLAAAPLSVVLAVVAAPAWGWFEARTGIESPGHSGPAGWCYVATLLACGTLAATRAWRGMRDGEGGTHDG